MEFDTGRIPDDEELLRLYTSVGWSAYTDEPSRLADAVRNSTFVVTARDGGRLVGLLRALSDDVSIVYVQDVLVEPSHQRRGIGRQLLDHCLERFAHVRQRVLLTDDESHQHRLYRSAGCSDVAQLRDAPLHAFVDIAGAGLVERDDG